MGYYILKLKILENNTNNIIQYVDFVPGGGLPNIKKALEAARDLLNISKSKS